MKCCRTTSLAWNGVAARLSLRCAVRGRHHRAVPRKESHLFASTLTDPHGSATADPWRSYWIRGGERSLRVRACGAPAQLFPPSLRHAAQRLFCAKLTHIQLATSALVGVGRLRPSAPYLNRASLSASSPFIPPGGSSSAIATSSTTRRDRGWRSGPASTLCGRRRRLCSRPRASGPTPQAPMLTSGPTTSGGRES